MKLFYALFQKVVFLFILCSFGLTAHAQDAFITTWRTTTANEFIIIPINSDYNYNYTVDWGDGTVESGFTGDAWHTYTTAGDYQVKISGVFPAIYFNYSGDREKMLSIDQWGSQEWKSFGSAFWGCTNLTYSATDSPNLTQVKDMSSMFYRALSFNGDVSSWDVGNVTDMSSMFWGAHTFNGDLINWDVSNVTNMTLMFSNATSFKGSIGNWDVSSVTDMYGMFFNATSFNEDLTYWDVGKVTSMRGMFGRASSFNGDISSWNVSNVTDMEEMFSNATSFNQNLGKWNVVNVRNLRLMFANAVSFNQDLSNWNVSQVVNMIGVFVGATSFDNDLSRWNISKATNMSGMLSNSNISLENYDNTLIGWAEQDVLNSVGLGANGCHYCFGEEARQILINKGWTITGDTKDCSGTFITTWRTTTANESIIIPTNRRFTYNYMVDWGDGTIGTSYTGDARHTYTTAGDYQVKILGVFPAIKFSLGDNNNKIIGIDQWGSQEWKSFEDAFYGCTNLTYSATDSPNLTQVKDMSSMFAYAKSFNGDLSNWDVSSVTDMNYMFSNALSFNGNISTWDVGQVTNMRRMFAQAVSFNGDLSNWNVGNVTDMNAMFYDATIFNQDLSKWNVSKVMDMSRLFSATDVFNSDLSNWDVSKVTNMSNMFAGAYAFNGELNTWDVSQVTNMNRMFWFATSFNQALLNWDVSKVTNMGEMFWKVNIFNQDLSTWQVNNVSNMEKMFADAFAFNQSLSSWDIGNVTKMDGMLNNSNISLENYDSTLIAWADQTVQNNITLGVEGLNYCLGKEARQTLIDQGWTITGDAPDCVNYREIAVYAGADTIATEIFNGQSVLIEFENNTTRQPITLYNSKAADLHISDITINSLEFGVENIPQVVKGNSSVTFDLLLSSCSKGEYAAIVSIASDDKDENPFTFPISAIDNFQYLNSLQLTVCSGDLPYLFGTQKLNSEGRYTETFKTSRGCDSTVTLTLNVMEETRVDTSITLCKGESYLFGSQEITYENALPNYTETFSAISGCDSIVHLNVKLGPNNLYLVDSSRLVQEEALALNADLFSFDYTFPSTADVFAEILLFDNEEDNNGFVLSGKKVLNNSVLDFETQNEFTLSVYARTEGGCVLNETINFHLQDVNEAPTGISLSTTVFSSETSNGSSIASISVIDEDENDVYTYQLVSGEGDTDNVLFSISGNQLQLSESASIQGEKDYSIRLLVRDAGGLTFEQSFQLHGYDENKVPEDIIFALIGDGLAEGDPIQTEVALFTTADENVEDSHFYSLDSSKGDNALFAIDGDKLVSAAILDYEEQSTYTVYVRSTDALGKFIEKRFQIDLVDVNEAPSDITVYNSVIPHNKADTYISNILISDDDLSDTHRFDIDNPLFYIQNGNIYVKHDFNEESMDYQATVTVIDQGGLSYSKPFTFTYAPSVTSEAIPVIIELLSPNSDGINDVLTIKNLSALSEPVNIEVFSRWGNSVYTSDDYLNTWDGESLPDGSYLYLMRYEEKEYRGFLDIRR